MSATDMIAADAEAISFAFDSDNRARAQRIVARYPGDRQASAVLPLLDLAQRQSGGWLPRAAIEYVADYLGMPNIRVHEVATFYSMFNLRPVGKYFVQVCRTTPCWLRGADDIVAACEQAAGCALGETSDDGQFTLVEVECLGACCNAPMVQINDEYFEDLTPQTTADLLNALKHGKHVKPGSQAGRKGSEPVGGRTTLLEAPAAAGTEQPTEPSDPEPSDPEPSDVEPADAELADLRPEADEDLAKLPAPAGAAPDPSRSVEGARSDEGGASKAPTGLPARIEKTPPAEPSAPGAAPDRGAATTGGNVPARIEAAPGKVPAPPAQSPAEDGAPSGDDGARTKGT